MARRLSREAPLEMYPTAPASRMAATCFASSNMERPMMLTAGSSAWMTRAVSMPLIPGHVHIHCHDVRAQLPRQCHRGFTVGGLPDDLDVGLLAELQRNAVSHHRVIVHQEDPDPALPRAAPATGSGGGFRFLRLPPAAATIGDAARSSAGFTNIVGTQMVNRLPCPGELSISMPPPVSASLSRMLGRPMPPVRPPGSATRVASNPTPSSLTGTRRRPSVAGPSRTTAFFTPECLTTLKRSSRTACRSMIRTSSISTVSASTDWTSTSRPCFSFIQPASHSRAAVRSGSESAGWLISDVRDREMLMHSRSWSLSAVKSST